MESFADLLQRARIRHRTKVSTDRLIIMMIIIMLLMMLMVLLMLMTMFVLLFLSDYFEKGGEEGE